PGAFRGHIEDFGQFTGEAVRNFDGFPSQEWTAACRTWPAEWRGGRQGRTPAVAPGPARQSNRATWDVSRSQGYADRPRSRWKAVEKYSQICGGDLDEDSPVQGSAGGCPKPIVDDSCDRHRPHRADVAFHGTSPQFCLLIFEGICLGRN